MSGVTSIQSNKPIVSAEAVAGHQADIAQQAIAIVEEMKQDLITNKDLPGNGGRFVSSKPVPDAELCRAVLKRAQQEFKGFNVSGGPGTIEVGAKEYRIFAVEAEKIGGINNAGSAGHGDVVVKSEPTSYPGPVRQFFSNPLTWWFGGTTAVGAAVAGKFVSTSLLAIGAGAAAGATLGAVAFAAGLVATLRHSG